MLSRALLRFHRFDLTGVPANKREPALRLRLAQWSPYRDADHCVIWNGERATVWCWDGARIRERVGPAGRSRWRAILIPETLLVEPGSEGARLVACIDGLEGQLWRQGELLSSRWWPKQPTPDEWATFLRDAGQTVEDGKVPAVRRPSQLDRPWASPRSVTAAASSQRALEWIVYAGLSGVLLLASLGLALQYARLYLADSSVKGQLQASHGRASTLLQARNAALADASRIRDLIALGGYPDQLRLMAATAEALPEDGTYVSQWLFEQGRLTVTFGATNRDLAGSQIIANLQGLPYFTDIRAVPGNDARTLQLTMRVNPLLSGSSGPSGSKDGAG